MSSTHDYWMILNFKCSRNFSVFVSVPRTVSFGTRIGIWSKKIVPVHVYSSSFVSGFTMSRFQMLILLQKMSAFVDE